MNLDKHVAPPKRPTKAYGRDQMNHEIKVPKLGIAVNELADAFIEIGEILAKIDKEHPELMEEMRHRVRVGKSDTPK